jgi:glycine dehydrogenase
VDQGVFPQTLDVLRTRAEYFGFELIIGPVAEAARHEVFGALLQYPDERGAVADIATPIAQLKAKGTIITDITDKKPWQDAVKPVVEKYGANYKKLVEQIQNTK